MPFHFYVVHTVETARLFEDVVATFECENPDSLSRLGEFGDAAGVRLQQLDVERQECRLDDATLVGVVGGQFVERRHQLVG